MLICASTYQHDLYYSFFPLVAVADNAYVRMREEETNQSILISGESGSGKTETTVCIQSVIVSNTTIANIYQSYYWHLTY